MFVDLDKGASAGGATTTGAGGATARTGAVFEAVRLFGTTGVATTGGCSGGARAAVLATTAGGSSDGGLLEMFVTVLVG